MYVVPQTGSFVEKEPIQRIIFLKEFYRIATESRVFIYPNKLKGINTVHTYVPREQHQILDNVKQAALNKPHNAHNVASHNV